jgi:hypothetical protein
MICPIDSSLTAQLVANRAAFEKVRNLKIVMDGGRIGEPQKEYIVSLFDNLDTEVSIWNAPEDFPPLLAG